MLFDVMHVNQCPGDQAGGHVHVGERGDFSLNLLRGEQENERR